MNQARTNEIFIDKYTALGKGIYNYKAQGVVEVDSAATNDPDVYPVEVRVTDKNGAEEGFDGAPKYHRSQISRL
ncbi:hypothetical protein ACO22_01672 [Paracoccidioides brasiliensis]|uniref:Uncharacterized protein n=1 Tax=Paracoccidioides brasiliensis TaxID=121759 RepID=A0A1D2JKW5_PARBR|nr:hypothetical protein ACO22_01672 [Paracoccidioides brasiliensis]